METRAKQTTPVGPGGKKTGETGTWGTNGDKAGRCHTKPRKKQFVNFKNHRRSWRDQLGGDLQGKMANVGETNGVRGHKQPEPGG